MDGGTRYDLSCVQTTSCCLLALVFFPDVRSRPAAATTRSSTEPNSQESFSPGVSP
jgi:hypothetical protein